ncbi:hypothetical protein GW17_00048008 [Ensete ventricosum]|nr:hypothetical protein GW17_00048008 [Ensete ventricosum]
MAMQRRRSYPVRDRIMRRYDQELLGAPLWCTTQQEEGLWIQGVNVVIPQKLLGGHNGVELGGRKGRGSDYESSGAQLPKSKALVRKEVESEEHHSAVEVDLPIMKEGMQM